LRYPDRHGHPPVWRLRDRTLTIERPLVLGIVNVTPDSFSDGGRYLDHAAAVAHALRLVDDGADLLDVGGESTRPGATPVPEGEELGRVLPVVEALAGRVSVPISVDTMKSEVARQALAAGAAIVNDVGGLRDPAMAAAVRDARAGAIVMHMQGTPPTMQLAPHYPDGVVTEVGRFFESRLQELSSLGIAPEQVVLDPGIGFGKTGGHNTELIARLGAFGRLGRPVCLGVSRKGFLGRLLDRPVGGRDAASLAVACYALAHGSAQVLRAHDAAGTRDAVLVFERLRKSGDG
jgi:dihydropteroate synthase